MSEGIGARLRSARERSRLTILQAAEKLHVDPDVLEALEADNFAALGAPVYIKGHLRHYAELVGESTEGLFALYSQGTQAPAPDLRRIAKPVADHAGRLVAPATAVVVGFAVAGTVWWGLSLSSRQWIVAASRPAPVSAGGATPMRQPAEPTRPVIADARASPVHLTGPVAAAVAAPAVATLRFFDRARAVSAPVAGRAAMDAVLTYSADSWTEVYDATGRRLLYGVSSAHATRRLQGIAPLSVTLGDASAVTIEVGGRAASISRFVRPDRTARFLIAADGRVLAVPRKNGG